MIAKYYKLHKTGNLEDSNYRLKCLKTLQPLKIKTFGRSLIIVVFGIY